MQEGLLDGDGSSRRVGVEHLHQRRLQRQRESAAKFAKSVMDVNQCLRGGDTMLIHCSATLRPARARCEGEVRDLPLRKGIPTSQCMTCAKS